MKDTKSSIQVAGYKEYFYGGIGSAAVFYSDLWHQKGIAEPETIKVAVFYNKKNKLLELITWNWLKTNILICCVSTAIIFINLQIFIKIQLR